MFKTDIDVVGAPPHPGEVLREDILPSVEMTEAELSKHLGIAPQVLANLLAERTPVSLDIARRLGAAFGYGTRYWLALQNQYDLWLSTQPSEINVRPIEWGRRRRAPSDDDRAAA